MNDRLKDKKIGVVCGGYSAERAVSQRSGQNVYEALIKKGYDVELLDPLTDIDWLNRMDVAFIALHGTYGEDGAVQACLESHDIPYTGSGVKASLICMNKLLSKQFFSQNDIPISQYLVFNETLTDIPADFHFPLVLKPTNQGSSVDVFIVDSVEELQKNTAYLSEKYDVYLVEEFIEGKEVTVSILDGVSDQRLPILELRPKNRFYDYHAKYTENQTEFVLPAELTPELEDLCQKIALKAHKCLGCVGMSRVDMIVHPKKGPFVLEVNSIPGLTNTSDLPAQAAHAGIEFSDLVEQILCSALIQKSR